MIDSLDIVEAGSFEQELFELIARYEDDVLDQVGLAKLNELLVGSAKARDVFNDVCLQSLTIGEALAAEEGLIGSPGLPAKICFAHLRQAHLELTGRPG